MQQMKELNEVNEFFLKLLRWSTKWWCLLSLLGSPLCVDKNKEASQKKPDGQETIVVLFWSPYLLHVAKKKDLCFSTTDTE